MQRCHLQSQQVLCPPQTPTRRVPTPSPQGLQQTRPEGMGWWGRRPRLSIPTAEPPPEAAGHRLLLHYRSKRIRSALMAGPWTPRKSACPSPPGNLLTCPLPAATLCKSPGSCFSMWSAPPTVSSLFVYYPPPTPSPCLRRGGSGSASRGRLWPQPLHSAWHTQGLQRLPGPRERWRLRHTGVCLAPSAQPVPPAPRAGCGNRVPPGGNTALLCAGGRCVDREASQGGTVLTQRRVCGHCTSLLFLPGAAAEPRPRRGRQAPGMPVPPLRVLSGPSTGAPLLSPGTCAGRF